MDIQQIKQKLKWLGHASFLLEEKNLKIYIDPYKLKTTLPKADLILVTHNHYDHFSKQDIDKIYKKETVIICNSIIASSISGYNVKVISAENEIEVYGVKIKAVVAYNIDKNFHSKSQQGLGFIIKTSLGDIYHCGDTDFVPEMKQIKCDIALLAVSGVYVMDSHEAAEAAKTIKPKIVIPMHYGEIVGTTNDAKELENLLKDTDIEVVLLDKLQI